MPRWGKFVQKNKIQLYTSFLFVWKGQSNISSILYFFLKICIKTIYNYRHQWNEKSFPHYLELGNIQFLKFLKVYIHFSASMPNLKFYSIINPKLSNFPELYTSHLFNKVISFVNFIVKIIIKYGYTFFWPNI